MNQLLNVDEENMMATAQCGYPLKALEEILSCMTAEPGPTAAKR